MWMADVLLRTWPKEDGPRPLSSAPIIQGLSWPLQLSSLQRRPPTAALLVRPFTAAIHDVIVRLRTQRLG